MNENGVAHRFRDKRQPEPVWHQRLEVMRNVIPDCLFGSDEIVAASCTPKDGIPQEGGVYFLIWEDRIVYVGQASNIYLRIIQHCAEKVFIDRIASICGVPAWFRTELEHAYIQAWSPPWNSERKRNGQIDELPEIASRAKELDSSAVMPTYTAHTEGDHRELWPHWKLQILARCQHLSDGGPVLLVPFE